MKKSESSMKNGISRVKSTTSIGMLFSHGAQLGGHRGILSAHEDQPHACVLAIERLRDAHHIAEPSPLNITRPVGRSGLRPPRSRSAARSISIGVKRGAQDHAGRPEDPALRQSDFTRLPDRPSRSANHPLIHPLDPEVRRIVRDIGEQRDVRRARPDAIERIPSGRL